MWRSWIIKIAKKGRPDPRGSRWRRSASRQAKNLLGHRPHGLDSGSVTSRRERYAGKGLHAFSLNSRGAPSSGGIRPFADDHPDHSEQDGLFPEPEGMELPVYGDRLEVLLAEAARLAGPEELLSARLARWSPLQARSTLQAL